MPPPFQNSAALGLPLALRTSTGAAPEYTAGSLNSAATVITLPAPYVPAGVTARTCASGRAMPRTETLPCAASEPGAPGLGSSQLNQSSLWSSTGVLPIGFVQRSESVAL